MKRIFSITCAAFFCAALATPAIAKTTNPGPIGRISTWTGTWTCGSGKNRNTETFVPIFNGKGMRVSVTGPQASEGVATFDFGHNAWFYTFVNADGTYATMSGPVSGSTIAFTQVFPAGTGKDTTRFTIRLMSTSKYSSVFSAIVNHKLTTSTEVCTKN